MRFNARNLSTAQLVLHPSDFRDVSSLRLKCPFRRCANNPVGIRHGQAYPVGNLALTSSFTYQNIPGSTWRKDARFGAHVDRSQRASNCNMACKASASSDSESSQVDETYKALQSAREALREAETSAQNVKHLPSASAPKKIPPILKKAAKALFYSSACAAVYLSHARSLWLQYSVAVLTSSLIGLQGYHKKSLDASGAVAATVIGGATLGSSLRCGAALFAFFFASSALTRYAEEEKDNDEAFKAGGQRNWKQVLCNAFVPAVLALLLARQTGGKDVILDSAARSSTRLMGAVLGYFACCCGDTWSSELGQLSKQQPRLITTGRVVRAGTNGGVTALGLGASAAGGCFVGAVFWAVGVVAPSLWPTGWKAAAAQWQIVPLGLVMGLVGSLIDSLLGATVQYTGLVRGKLTSRYSEGALHISGMALLSNNGVNLVSATISSFLGSLIVAQLAWV